MKAKTLALIALTGIGILACMPAVAAENPPAVQAPPAVQNLDEVTADASGDACLNYTPVEGTLQLELAPELESSDTMAKPPKPCKACPDQPWCACTYNGHPRVSCDPCCYSTWTGEICTS